MTGAQFEIRIDCTLRSHRESDPQSDRPNHSEDHPLTPLVEKPVCLAPRGESRCGCPGPPRRRRGGALGDDNHNHRFIKGAFPVTGKDIEARNFEPRREAKNWCVTHYPGSPFYEIGADSSKRKTRAMPRKGA
jgi:hypothetical protein